MSGISRYGAIKFKVRKQNILIEGEIIFSPFLQYLLTRNRISYISEYFPFPPLVN